MDRMDRISGYRDTEMWRRWGSGLSASPSLIPLLAGGLLVAAIVGTLAASGTDSALFPPAGAAFASTREVTSLVIAPDGDLWVGTAGGVLRHSREGAWEKFTRRDGLPAHEVRRLLVKEGEVVAVLPRAASVWREGRWLAAPVPRVETAPSAQQTCETIWRGARCVATVPGLRIHEGGAWRQVSLPVSTGTHVSALLPRGDTLWAALFGDGLWSFDGGSWRPLDLSLPPAAREITAMAGDDGRLWLGTRREGVWEYDGKGWKQHLQPDEPYNHNVQALAAYRGRLFVSTLEDGLAVRTTGGWQHETGAVLSSSAPRQMVPFQDRLYLRHGNGKVDRFDGRRWQRDVCSSLPRKQVSALATDAHRLYAAQWGGWSEFDGRSWIHHLNLPELQGVPITALCPNGATLWVGTQGRGIAQVDRATGQLRWHDERHGLPDDWVTVIERVGGSLAVGTFVGGLAQWDGARWTTAPALKGENVTALTPDGASGMFIGTRSGVWHQTESGSLLPLVQRFSFLDSEIQALYLAPGGLWVGTRTGLFFCRTLS
jgi:ligand-binding sensor domain-containing protein